jgi:BirA family biotin operon repressor/biotin-[acetyl-CoA-carboxylase] ligase
VLPEPRFGRSLVPMALGVAVADALEEYGARTELKWPNDLLVVTPGAPPRKLAGVIVDRVVPPRHPVALVAGVGVNVTADPTAFPGALRERVAHLTELAGHPVRVEDVEAKVVPRLREAIDGLSTREGWRRTASRCRSVLFGRGHRATVDGRLSGTIGELGDDGSLWLAGDDGPIQVISGNLLVEET